MSIDIRPALPALILPDEELPPRRRGGPSDSVDSAGDPIECPACFNDKLRCVDEVYAFANCGHVICLVRLIKLAEKESSLLRCPMCRGTLHADEVQLRQDEENKGRHCAHCPNCQKIVYKMGGCDTMKCGQDADGGNDQSGCGTVFGWEEARSRHPYRPQIPKMPDIGQLERLLFNDCEAVQSVQGPGTHPMHFRCQLCDEHPIKGLRFECMNCPGEVSLCRNCMMATQRLPGHLHAADHTFRIYEPSIPPPRQSDDRGRDDIVEYQGREYFIIDDSDDDDEAEEPDRTADEWRVRARARWLAGVDGDIPAEFDLGFATPPLHAEGRYRYYQIRHQPTPRGGRIPNKSGALLLSIALLLVIAIIVLL